MFKSVAKPKLPSRQEHNFYKNVVLQAIRNKRKAVLVPHPLTRTAYFADMVVHAARRLNTSVYVYCDSAGWYVWYKGSRQYKKD